MPPFVLIVALAVAPPLPGAGDPHSCAVGPRATSFLQHVRAMLSPSDSTNRPYGVPSLPPSHISLVVDDSVCAAVSRVLGSYVKSGALQPQARARPFPIELVRAGPAFFVHDTSLSGAEQFVYIDTLRLRPGAPYALLSPYSRTSCAGGRWKLLTDVTLYASPGAGSPPVTQVAAGTEVDTDSGVIVVDTVGIVVVEAPGWPKYMYTGLEAGDTLLTLFWVHPEGTDLRNYTAWWRGLLITVPELWVATQHWGAVQVREPHWLWWVRMRPGNSSSLTRGWVRMTDSVRLRPGDDDCY